MAQLAGATGGLSQNAQGGLSIAGPILGALADRRRSRAIAKDLKVRGTAAAQIARAEGSRIVGAARTAFAKAGVQAESGSPTDVLAEAAADVELQALREQFEFLAAAKEVKRQSKIRFIEGIARSFGPAAKEAEGLFGKSGRSTILGRTNALSGIADPTTIA